MVNSNSSLLPHLAKNVADDKLNTERALFQTVKEGGGVSGAASTSSLPWNYTQVQKPSSKSWASHQGIKEK